MLKSSSLAAISLVAMAAPACAQDNHVLTGQDAFGDWEKDAPGVVRWLKQDDLPKPFVEPSASNSPGTVPMPAEAKPKVPVGFKIDLVATGIENPRAIRFA